MPLREASFDAVRSEVSRERRCLMFTRLLKFVLVTLVLGGSITIISGNQTRVSTLIAADEPAGGSGSG